jgi:hypothetical protein
MLRSYTSPRDSRSLETRWLMAIDMSTVRSLSRKPTTCIPLVVPHANRQLPRYRFSRSRNFGRKYLQLQLTNLRARAMPMPLGVVSLQRLIFRHLSPTMVLNSIGKSCIGISRFPLSCARDFQFPDPRLYGISRHVSQLTDGSDPVGKSWIAIPTCKSFLSLKTSILLLCTLRVIPDATSHRSND